MRLILVWFLFSTQIFAQQYIGKEGVVSFFSATPIEDIQAVNKNAAGVIDTQRGSFAFQIKIEDFVFPNSLMQEHFNESYMESDKYPVSTFVGEIADFSSLDLSKEQAINVNGELLVHGVKRQVSLTSSVQLVNNTLNLKSTFDIALEDHKIDIPKIMLYKIAEVINVNIEMSLQKKSNE